MSTEAFMLYVARHECGKIVAAAVDLPDHKKALAREMADWVRRGDTVERIPNSELPASLKDWCRCFIKKSKAEKVRSPKAQGALL